MIIPEMQAHYRCHLMYIFTFTLQALHFGLVFKEDTHTHGHTKKKTQFCIILTHHEAEVQKCLLIVTETKCISEEGEESQGDYFLHYHLSAICSVFISLM